jgi:sugar phosphate isomerase/epimerase
MKIGMLTGLWFVAESATVLASLRRVADLGFHYVDLQGGFHAGPVHLTEEERVAVGQEMAALGLEPRSYVLDTPHNLASANDAELKQCYEYLKEGVDLALTWGMNQVMVNAGRWAYGVSREEAWMKAVRFLQRVCDYAAPRGVYVACEAEPYIWFLVNDITSTVRLLEDVNRPNLATVVDLGHMALAREGPDDLARLGDSIIHAHFSDHQSFRHTNQVIGTGITQTADYLNALRRMDVDRLVRRFGYDEFVVSVELGVPGDVIADPDDWVRRSLQHVRRVAPDMTVT